MALDIPDDIDSLLVAWAKRPKDWDQLCLDEGWLLSNVGFIERDDDSPRFKDDNEARAWVQAKASAGSERHQLALAINDIPPTEED